MIYKCPLCGLTVSPKPKRGVELIDTRFNPPRLHYAHHECLKKHATMVHEENEKQRKQELSEAHPWEAVGYGESSPPKEEEDGEEKGREEKELLSE